MLEDIPATAEEWEEARQSVARSRAYRKERVEGYEGLVQNISSRILAIDPIGIRGKSADEYEMEAELIVIALLDGVSANGLTEAIHKVFIDCFDENMAGPVGRFSGLASDVWSFWSQTRRIYLV